MLRIQGITKRFGDVAAVNAVTIEAQAGEVVAVLGENGAGKSTLLSCIAGFVTADSGSISIGGVTLQAGEPADAIRHGVGTAFQHVSLVPSFTVAESFALSGVPESAWSPLLSDRIPAAARIDDLGIAERQQVEFLKARLIGRNVLLLDEPTSPLGDIDVERVLCDIASAASDGATVLFVTHRLREALAVADRIVVMRHGFMVGEWRRSEGEWEREIEQELVSAMFGSSDSAREGTRRLESEPPLQGVITITERSNERQVEISKGRVLAIVGIAGNGQQHLVELLAGERNARVELHDADGAVEAHDAGWLRDHSTVIPEDRIGEGGAPEMTVGETLVLRDLVENRLQAGGWLRRRALRRRGEAMIASWQVSPSDPSIRFGNLSGGNMQRVVLARALDPAPDLLIAMNPTQGLDLATASSVRERLRDAADTGTAVVSIEQDVDEALEHGDLVGVLFQNQLSAPLPAGEIDRQRLQLMMVAGW